MSGNTYGNPLKYMVMSSKLPLHLKNIIIRPKRKKKRKKKTKYQVISSKTKKWDLQSKLAN